MTKVIFSSHGVTLLADSNVPVSAEGKYILTYETFEGDKQIETFNNPFTAWSQCLILIDVKVRTSIKDMLKRGGKDI